MSLLFRQTEIIGFINDLCDTFAQEVTQKNISLQFDHGDMNELDVWVDPANFDKIVLNILSNAFKFTPSGGSVHISLTKGEDDAADGPLRHYMELVIADTGIGIANGEMEHVFERFYQIRNNLNNSNVGTGVGLHLTRSLVELHHGTIHTESNADGPGTRFVIRIPLGNSHLRPEELDNSDKQPAIELPVEDQPASVISTAAVDDESKVRSKSKNWVLIVEDDE